MCKLVLCVTPTISQIPLFILGSIQQKSGKIKETLILI